MSMKGELSFFLGLQVKQMKDGTFINQTKYTRDLMKKFGMEASRPDINFAVGLCARFQSTPKESHMTAAKRILRYLKGCQEVGLWYPKEGGFKLIGYSDSDYARCRVDRKSTSGTCQMLGNRMVSWFNMKENSIATSTIEAEYIAAGCYCAQVLWMRQKLRDYEIEEKQIPIMCDNTKYISTDKQLADIFTKPLCESRFEELKNELGLNELS
ncbi:hypothetical protein DH2020_027163 [Rehmannia glutinosa]|uniref:Reverse transcriptase Ty1/copia-type domain-containing protein n=1 Tax=Rehmannia glutinosa TaxID=99300 RepID=A0ABR0VVW7_REHGL